MQPPNLLVAFAAASVAGLTVLMSCQASSGSGRVQDQMRLSFEGSSAATLRSGSTVHDASGSGNDGTVAVANGGKISLVDSGSTGHGAAYPSRCLVAGCPRAVISVKDDADLDPESASFVYGARLRLWPGQTSKGGNVVQKGLFDEVGGQWKLQVDGYAGKPSCVISGTKSRVILWSNLSVADGAWHIVKCRRIGREVTLFIDGKVRAQGFQAVGTVSNRAPVRVGGRDTAITNDQYFGQLDEVFFRLR